MKNTPTTYRATVRRLSYDSYNQRNIYDIPSTSQRPPTRRFILQKESGTAEAKRRVPVSRWHKIRNAIRRTYNTFCESSTVHGLQFLHPDREQFEKFFWLVLLLVALINCLYLTSQQYMTWQEKPVIISFSEFPVPVSYIPFPAITICHENTFKKNTLDFARFVRYMRGFADRSVLFQPPPWISDDEFLKMRSLLQICGRFASAGVQFPDYEPLNVDRHLDEIMPPFEDNFLFCVFNHKKGNCGQYFERIYTKNGICYTFNALNETEVYRESTYQYRRFVREGGIRDSRKELNWAIDMGYRNKRNYDTYPERVMGSGLHSGLLVVLQGFEADINTFCRGIAEGFKVILHAPNDIPRVDRRFVIVPYSLDILLLIEPHIEFTRSDVKSVEPKRRKCYYPSERYLRFFKYYTQNNCELECLSNYTYQLCGCVHFSMPRDDSMKVCDANAIHCYSQVDNSLLLSEFSDKRTVRGIKKCNCLPGCWSLVYHVEISRGILNVNRILKSHTEFMNKSDDGSVSRLTTFFRANSFSSIERSKFFGLDTFIAHVAGLLGLWLGISVIGFIQILYLWTINLYMNIQNRNGN